MSKSRTSELHLESLGIGSFIDAVPEGLFIVNSAGIIELVNTRLKRLGGFEAQDIRGKPISEFLRDSDEQQPIAFPDSYLTNPASETLELPDNFSLLCADGTALFVSVSLGPLPVEDQHFTLVSVQDVSRLRQTKAELRDSKNRLEEAQRIAQLGSWDRDLVTNKVYWSDEIARLLQLDADADPQFETLTACIFPDDRPAAEAAYVAAMANKTPYDFEHRIVRPDGTIKHVRVCCEFKYDAEGNPIRSTGTIQDITIRKEHEQQLENFRAALQASPDAVYFTDMEEKRFLYVNKIATLWTGLSEAELLQVNPQDVLQVDDETLERSYQAAVAAGSAGTLTEMQLPDANGKPAWYELKRHAISDGGKTVIITIVRNITEAKEREREMQRFRAAMDATMDMIYVTDRETMRFIYANKRGLELTGFSEEELLTKGPADVFRGREIEIEAEFDKVIAAGDEGTVTQMKSRSLDGVNSVVEVRRKALCLDGHWFIVTISQDIGVRVRAERELQAMHEQLEQRVAERTMQLEIEIDQREKASQAKNKFLASMSHELRTPLNSILGFAQLLEIDESSGPRRERQQQHLRRILTSGEQLLQLITDLLELNNLEEGRLLVQNTELSALEIIDEVLNQIQFRSREKQVSLVNLVSSQAQLPKLWSDSQRLKQVLMSLLGNAINYNVPGGSVTVYCSENTPYMLRINIVDTGCGIPKESWNAIFVPFERIGREAGTIGGSGIGLSFAKRIIELMGGKIGFESKVGEGSTFWIEVPEYRGTAGAKSESAKSATSGSVANAPVRELVQLQSPKVVLYVEDDPENMSLMQQILERIPNVKIEMIPAHNAEIGIELALERHPDLILMDINLPKMSGNEAVQKLKQMEETRDIPVIAVSADATPHSIETAIQNGFESYITKPIKVMRLRESVIKSLGL